MVYDCLHSCRVNEEEKSTCPFWWDGDNDSQYLCLESFMKKRGICFRICVIIFTDISHEEQKVKLIKNQ